MKIKPSTFITAVSLAVAIIGFVAAVSLSSKNRSSEELAAGLRERIELLEAQLSRTRGRNENARAGNTATNELAGFRRFADNRGSNQVAGDAESGSETNRPPRQRESFAERMARMKEEEPERYEEMIAERRERQERMRYGMAERTASFMDLDTSRMTEDELLNHQQLVEKMAQVWELTNRFSDPEEAPDRETMREMFGVMREVQPMLQQERTVMFKQLGYDLGYEGGEADEFAAYAEEIIDLTSMRSPFGGGSRGRGGDRGGGGDRGDGGDRGGGGDR